MRMPAERLLKPQLRLTGANISGWKRRYEFWLGAKIAIDSGISACSPPMA